MKKTSLPWTVPLAPAALLLATLGILGAGRAHATGLRISGDITYARDTSYDAFSSKDKRSSLDLSFSYSVLYLGCAVLLDVEAGYAYSPEVKDLLFGSYTTSILSHGVYGGARISLRIDRDVVEWLQPFARVDGGYMWAKGRLSSAAGGITVEDWGSNGFIYAGAGVQVTIPVAFIREKMHICISKRFSVGLGAEIGYIKPWPMKFSMGQGGDGNGNVDPIPVQGVDLGGLDLEGMTVRFGLVVTF